ncbi:hypothetical protein [Sulfitobacter sediminilitoris]|uniref:hypothetical protein n=1 Tax=Sulfitobacter sediminilitoris TaxID=2698830 RepID=UPI003619BFD3
MNLSYELTTERQMQLGLVVLQSDETLEYDMRRLLPEDVELLVSRVASGTELSTDMIAAMEGRLTDAANLLPRDAVISAVGYGCTSASAQIGSARVAELIKRGFPRRMSRTRPPRLLPHAARLGLAGLVWSAPISPASRTGSAP